MNVKRTVVLTMLALAGGLSWGALRPAQDDAVLTDLLEKMTAAATEDRSAYMLTVQTMTMAGTDGTEIISDMWIRDRQHFRMEDSRGNVIVVTAEGIKMRFEESNAMLHIPAETIGKLKEEGRDAVLMRLGVGSQDAMVEHMIEMWESLTISGQQVVGEEPCWVLTGGDETVDAIQQLASMTSSIEMDVHVEIFEMLLEKEAGVFRGLHYGATMTPAGGDPMSMAIEMTVPAIEFDIEVPDEMFEYEPPEGTEIVVWTPDKEVEDLGPVFRRMFGEAQDGRGGGRADRGNA